MTIPFRPVPPVASWAATHKEAKMVRHPKTLIDFMEMYPTEEDCRQALFEHRWPQRRHENPCGQRCAKSAWRQSSSVGYISMKSISVFGCRTIFASLWVAAQEATGGTGRKGMVMPLQTFQELIAVRGVLGEQKQQPRLQPRESTAGPGSARSAAGAGGFIDR